MSQGWIPFVPYCSCPSTYKHVPITLGLQLRFCHRAGNWKVSGTCHESETLLNSREVRSPSDSWLLWVGRSEADPCLPRSWGWWYVHLAGRLTLRNSSMASLIQAVRWAWLFSKGQGQSDLLGRIWGVCTAGEWIRKGIVTQWMSSVYMEVIVSPFN